jgi:ABC-type dipeptide/oligopeptide/nickel transport system ATPase subunit
LKGHHATDSATSLASGLTNATSIEVDVGSVVSITGGSTSGKTNTNAIHYVSG